MPENLLQVYTDQAMEVFGDRASREYYRRLGEERTLCGTRCVACDSVSLPPRGFCPDCFAAEVEWVDVGRHATLHAFTTQARALRFVKPAVIGVVEIPDVGLLVVPIEGRYDDLRIGQPLLLDVMDVEGGPPVPRFVPAGSE